MHIDIQTDTPISKPTPVLLEPQGEAVPDGDLVLVLDDGRALPAQRLGDGRVVVMVDQLDSGQRASGQLQAAAASTGRGVVLRQDNGTLDLQLPEGPFSTYHFGAEVIRPYLWPVYGPGQKPVTRNYPMEAVAGEQTDHPHHRSLWTAFDEVNGVNNWHDAPGHGFIRHLGFDALEQGPVCAGFTARNLWTDSAGTPVMDELRTVRLYNAGERRRLLDYAVTWTAGYGGVEFGDTKEAGIISVRVATSMDGARGGHIESGNGGHGEKECWGRPSPWCDYSGPVDGETLGIAVLDHPSNPGHPTRWHVRDYGLMTANPLSTAAFVGGDPTPGRLPQGESWTFRYRVLIHRGGASEGGVAQAYTHFAPQVV